MRQLSIPQNGLDREDFSVAGRGEVRPRLLGVFAHPDDEIFCAGGTIAQWARAGAEVMVVSATHGEAGQIRDVRVATRRTLGEIREAELRLSCGRLGVAEVRCWDYVDGTLADADFDHLTGRVAQAMREFRPDTVVSFGPDGGYGHPDHVTISAATTAAWHRVADPKTWLEPPEQFTALPGPYRPSRMFHAHFPTRDMLLMDRLAIWLTTRSDRFAGSSDYVHALLLMVKEAGTMRYLSDHEQVQWYPAGSCVVEQGEASSELFIILSGTAEVWQHHGQGDRRRLRIMGPGEFFGELGIAGNRTRSADVVATESLTCLVLSRGETTKFTGRGAGARLTGPAPRALNNHPSQADRPLDTRSSRPSHDQAISSASDDEPDPVGSDLIETDVSDVIGQKVSALCAYRTQLPLEQDMFPTQVLIEIFGRECFLEVPRPNGPDCAKAPGRPGRPRSTYHVELGQAMEVEK